MKIVTFDVGVGTIDVLVWNSEEINLFKMVMPSTLQYLANKIKEINNKDLLIDGIEMGGYPVSAAIIDHISKGNKVYMMDPAWKTINNEKKRVLNAGIQIINKDEKDELLKKNNIEEIYLSDLEIHYFFNIFKYFTINTKFDYIGLAVQDHGFSPEKTSSTNFRRKWMVEMLKKNPKFDQFLFKYDEVPDYLSRSTGLSKYIYEKTRIPTFISDTVIAASKGCLYHPSPRSDQIIAMDVGNGHTCAFSIDKGEISGYFEYHTHAISPKNLRLAIKKLADGTLTNDEVLKQGGHGAYVEKGLGNNYEIIVTGPRRNIMEETKLNYILGAPFGDHMITGAVGLLKMILERVGYE
jgi:uncharacterized protein (DUF1786 family)